MLDKKERTKYVKSRSVCIQKEEDCYILVYMNRSGQEVQVVITNDFHQDLYNILSKTKFNNKKYNGKDSEIFSKVLDISRAIMATAVKIDLGKKSRTHNNKEKSIHNNKQIKTAVPSSDKDKTATANSIDKSIKKQKKSKG